ncbi:MAG: hypothetical protein ACRDWY_08540 [Actinomycetes bacterium]
MTRPAERDSALAATRYVRNGATLWRDVGTDVVLLPRSRAYGAVVLSGGAALLWRLIDQPRTVREIVELAGTGGSTTTIGALLMDLSARGAVHEEQS